MCTQEFRDKNELDFSIVIPIYNEEDNIMELLRRVTEVIEPNK